MGTTSTALRGQQGVRYGFALLIQGYEYILCDAGEAAPVVTAYAATNWASALPGLKVVGGIKQSIEPLKAEMDIPSLSFQIMDWDGNDTFGKAVWKSKATKSSRLNALFQPAADGSGTVIVRDNAVFDASGEIYIGTRKISYSAKSGSTQLTVPAGGSARHFPADVYGASEVYSTPQQNAPESDYDSAASPRVTNVPSAWVGKHVALYIHRIVNGVWDTFAQAQLEFAGTISKIEDGDGITVLQCVDMRKRIEDATLLSKQFRGIIRSRVRVRIGATIQAAVWYPTADPDQAATTFTVVDSGASGADEMDDGFYEFDDFLSKVNAWLASESAALGGQCSLEKKITQDGWRVVASATFTTSAHRSFVLYFNDLELYSTLGWENMDGGQGGSYNISTPAFYGTSTEVASPGPPYRIRFPAKKWHITGLYGFSVSLGRVEGTFFEGSGYYPNFLKEYAETQGTSNWSYFQLGSGRMVIGKWNSGTSAITHIIPMGSIGSAVRKSALFGAEGITWDDGDDDIVVKQIVVLAGKFSDIVPKLLLSIGGTAGVNHSTYDVLPFGAAIPWSLLGDDFINSCKSLETAGKTDTVCVVLDKPKPVSAVLGPEMALRFAYLIFKDGVYQFASPTAPNALTADHTLNETNKADADGDPAPSQSEWTSEWMVNVVKVNYGNDGQGNYIGDHSPLTVSDQVSIGLFGQSDPVTVDAVNSSGARGVSGSAVEQLVSELSSRLFPMFGRPVKVVRRSIAPTLFHMAPGDTVTLSDDMVRDPVSGARGLSSRACICLSTFHDYGHDGGRMTGEVTLLLSDEDRTYPLSPAAEIDTSYTSGLYTNGYDSTNFRLKLKDHSFSKSTAVADATDVNNFDNGDLIRILELDPADPTSPEAWDRTLHASAGVSTGTGYLQMTASLSSPSYSGSTKKYVVVPQSYTSVQASQKLHAYQADSDGLILDAAEENSFGTQKQLNYSAGVATDLPALIPTERTGDGKPITPYELQYMTRMVNNLVSYKTATHLPWSEYSPANTSASAYRLMFMAPVWIGGFQLAGRTRYLSVAPMIKSTSGATVYARMLSSRFAPTGSLDDPWYIAGYNSVEFTTTSTTHNVPTALDLLPIPASMPGYTWISIQMKADGGDICNVHGWPVFYLKAIA